MNVNIFLKQFKMTNEAIVALIKHGDDKQLGTEKLKGLLKALPEKDEVENMHSVTEIQSAFGFRPPSDIISDRVKASCTKYESCDNHLLYSVGFLCQLLLDINWFIPEYIINCIVKCLQILICLVKLFASIFLSLFIIFVLLFLFYHFGE